jgi:YD repeat-containing protein
MSSDAATCPGCGYAPGHIRLSHGSTPRTLTIAFGVCGLLLVAGLLVVSGVLGFWNAHLTGTDAYKNSLAIAQSSPEVRRVLGNHIRAEWPVRGYSLPSHDSEFAQWSVKLRGSLGQGYLYGVANEINGTWEYSRLAFVPETGIPRVDLNKNPPPLQLPRVPAQSVYLIPIGLAENEPLDWAPQYYKAKFGIEVVLLSRAELNPSLENPQRHQLNASKCVDFLRHLRPDLASDPSAILIGITSRDMYIPDFDWAYAENWRYGGHFAIVSSARLHPPSPMGEWNPEWLNSRVQKLLTKNIAMLYFGLPLSADDTSLLSGVVSSGMAIDRMGGQVIGADGAWDSFINSGDPGFTVYDSPEKPAVWRLDYLNQPVTDTRAQLFNIDLSLGLFIQRKMDFIFDDDYPLQFTRVYTNNDGRSRAFGVGATHTLDLFLAGQMGSYVDLCLEDGARIHFVHQHPQPGEQDTYSQVGGWTGPFAGTAAKFDGSVWRIQRNDGWTLFFPYHPNWLLQYVTVLGSFTDPTGREYKMERDNVGDLLSVTTPPGKWLHFDYDARHRIRRIDSSLGRTVHYEYDPGGRLIRTVDSDGHTDVYTYDEKSQMLTAAHENGVTVVTNTYSNDSYIESQTVADSGKFEFSYFRGPRNVIYESQITDPHELLTSFLFRRDSYTQTLPRVSGR